MANTITHQPGIIHIIPDGVAAYDITVDVPVFATGISLTAIKFVPSAATDKLVVRNGSATGKIITTILCSTLDTKKEYIITGQKYKPYLKVLDQTWGTPASCQIWFEYD